MYEELKKSLRLCGRMINADDNCIAYYDGSCERWPVCAYDMMKEAADAIEELSKPRWISVNDELPQKTGMYLVRGKWANLPEMYWVCEFASFGYIKGWCNPADNPCVTHWMPLPEPPEEE